MHKIQKILKKGDVVYSPTGKPIGVTQVFATGFVSNGKYYSYDEHRVKFF